MSDGSRGSAVLLQWLLATFGRELGRLSLLHTMLARLYSVIDIAVSTCSSMGVSSAGLSIFSRLVASAKVEVSATATFRGLPLGRGSPAGAFLFDGVDASRGHSLNSFAPYSDSSMYDNHLLCLGGPNSKMFCCIGAVSSEYPFPDFLIIRL